MTPTPDYVSAPDNLIHLAVVPKTYSEHGRFQVILVGSGGNSFSGYLNKEQAVRMVQLFDECEQMIAKSQQPVFGDGCGI